MKTLRRPDVVENSLDIMIYLKSFLFLIIAPGLVAGYIPLAWFRSGPQLETGVFSYLALPLWAAGGLTLLWCFWDFAQKGRGTPAPIEPPKELVVSGLYRYVRNPMYVGICLIVIGDFLRFGYWNLLAYALFLLIVFHLFVTLYEEPNLRIRFGPAYEEYLKRVPRWIPRIR